MAEQQHRWVRVRSLMIEIRRDSYLDEATGVSKSDVIEVPGERLRIALVRL